MRAAKWVVLAMVGVMAGCGGQTPVSYPSAEQAFFQLNEACSQSYSSEQNEIRKSLAFNECNRKRVEFSRRQQIKGWVGTIADISTDQGADVVSVTISASMDSFELKFGTVNNRVSDFATHSLITPASPLFKALSQLNEGDTVSFDAEFLPHPDSARGIWEGSMTEQGSMTEPEFNVRFTRIERYVAGGAPTSSSPDAGANPPTTAAAATEVSGSPQPTQDAARSWGEVCTAEVMTVPDIESKASGFSAEQVTAICSCMAEKDPEMAKAVAEAGMTTASGAVDAAYGAFDSCSSKVEGDHHSASGNAEGNSKLAALVGKTYGDTKTALSGLGYVPEFASPTDVYPHQLDGDVANCGNAGCSVPWILHPADERLCVGVRMNDGIKESEMVVSSVEPGACQ